MKKIIFYAIYLILAFAVLLACKKEDAFNPEKLPQVEKTSSSKVQITFEEVAHGAWLQLDNNEKFYHYLDTNKFKDLADTVIIQRNYPRDFPRITDFSTGWVSEQYFVGLVSGRWFKSYSSGGLPSYSLFRNLVETKALANPYGVKTQTATMQYKISFENIKSYSDSLQFYYLFPDGRGFLDKKEADKYSVLNIERLDGKDVKITTSEGYKIKVGYQ
jgi:hypothetical protein